MMLMLGEYTAIATMCAMGTIMFLGGWLAPFPVPPFTWVPGVIWFTLKCLFMFFLFAMAKAIVPRYRYDQLMRLGWKVFLPHIDGDGGDRCGRAAIHGTGAEMTGVSGAGHLSCGTDRSDRRHGCRGRELSPVDRRAGTRMRERDADADRRGARQGRCAKLSLLRRFVLTADLFAVRGARLLDREASYLGLGGRDVAMCRAGTEGARP